MSHIEKGKKDVLALVKGLLDSDPKKYNVLIKARRPEIELPPHGFMRQFASSEIVTLTITRTPRI